ncbi:hypothetical protein TrST_g7700 [Triparma strigata]|uniref:Elongation of fatty acids protein n=1 Tax=Triparma strigata TaxID=1606541 RepID=A0A9W7E3K3_9STRA|nr:hypothetical protein TrST_g7700 [Triparma strigata]
MTAVTSITTVTDLMASKADDAIDLCMDVKVLAGLLAVYLFVSKPATVAIRDGLGVDPKGFLLKQFVFWHNVVLAVFSGVVFFKSLPIMMDVLKSGGWEGLHTDAKFFDGTDFGWWAKVFYVSKFYEFIDTWILILKGKEASFLQVYHHTGIAIAMWAACVTGSNWVVWPVVLNSFIHTLMYTYFAAATLGCRSPLAKMLTTMQLTQFVMGITLSSSTYVYGKATQEQVASLVFIQVYAVGLIYLFGQMYKNKYNKKKV